VSIGVKWRYAASSIGAAVLPRAANQNRARPVFRLPRAGRLYEVFPGLVKITLCDYSSGCRRRPRPMSGSLAACSRRAGTPPPAVAAGAAPFHFISCLCQLNHPHLVLLDYFWLHCGFHQGAGSSSLITQILWIMHRLLPQDLRHVSKALHKRLFIFDARLWSTSEKVGSLAAPASSP